MYVTKIPNRTSPPAILLRESYREKGKVKTRTLANLSHLPKRVIEIIRRSLKGDHFVSTQDEFEKVNSWHHGHVDAVCRAMRRLGFERLISARRCEERDIVTAMVIGRILEPDNEKNSKLANTRWWKITTLPSIFDLGGVEEDDLYEAMDWLLKRQEKIEKKLAQRHLVEGGIVLYDLTSSYFEGVKCPLAALGHNRDGKKGKLQVNYGLLTDDRGRPVSVQVFPGNTLDHKTLMSQAQKVRVKFGINTMVLVGDRGMITQKLIDEQLRKTKGIDWITALKSGTIQKLVRKDQIQLSLFDDENLFEISVPEYPGERLIVCRNSELARLRNLKRRSLLKATKKKLCEVRSTVEGGKLRGKDNISRRLNNLVKKYKVSKHTSFKIRDDKFSYDFDSRQNVARAALNGALKEFKNVRSSISRGKSHDKIKIKKRIDNIIAKYNLNKHVTVDYMECDFQVNLEDEEAAASAAFESVRKSIEDISYLVACGKYGGKDEIGVRIGKVINKYKVSKHFVLNIRNDGFDFHIDENKVATEAELDGIYVVRTSLSKDRLSSADTVRSYKSLSRVERAFRSFKTVDLKVRPIRHHLEIRVRAHIFLCMLAYYVEWHMREVWRPLIFADEDLDIKNEVDPVKPAKRSDNALKKIKSKRLDDGIEVNSFQTLLNNMSQIVRNECRLKDNSDDSTFEILTTPNEVQQRAYDLLKNIDKL